MVTTASWFHLHTLPCAPPHRPLSPPPANITTPALCRRMTLAVLQPLLAIALFVVVVDRRGCAGAVAVDHDHVGTTNLSLRRGLS